MKKIIPVESITKITITWNNEIIVCEPKKRECILGFYYEDKKAKNEIAEKKKIKKSDI